MKNKSIVLKLPGLQKKQDPRDKNFRWTDREGRRWKLTDMTTKHVFYSWLMLWNHYAPQPYDIGGIGNRYAFIGTVKDPEKSFRELTYELVTRTDATDVQKAVVQRVIENAAKMRPEDWTEPSDADDDMTLDDIFGSDDDIPEDYELWGDLDEDDF